MHRIGHRFTLAAGSVLLLLIVLFAALEYRELRRHIIEEAYARTGLVLDEVEAVQGYVREQLRPAVRDLLPPHAFVPEAMSTTFVAREVAGRLVARNPDYYFKFAALDPRNPANAPDDFEREMIERFSRDPGAREWRGTVRRPRGIFLVSASPILVEDSCLPCHGDPRDAPAQLVAAYGDLRGFGRRAGEVAGIRSVAIPVSVPLANARRQALTHLLFALVGAGLLTAGGGYAFRRLVSRPLGALERYATAIGRGEERPALPPVADDEIGLLGRTLEQTRDQLQEKSADLLRRNADLERARDELRGAHAHLAALFRAVPDGLLLINEDYTIADINEAACELLGVRREEALGRRCHEVSHGRSSPCGGDGESCPLREVLASGEEHRVVHLHRRGHETRHVEVTAALLPAEGGRGAQVVEALRDVTRAVEAHDLVARKSAELEGFIQALGHDLRAPLANVRGYAELLEKGALGPEEAGRALRRVRSNAGVMARLIDDLLELSRIGIREEPSEETDAAAALGEALRIHEGRIAGRGAEVRIAPGLPLVRYPRTRLLQVFANLVGNALEHTAGQERLRIEIDCDEGGGEHRFAVRDNGPGIESGELEAVFEPFRTGGARSAWSTGLGLAIVRRIVEKNGGRIWVESAPGRGAAFFFTVPAAPGAGGEDASA